MSNINTSSHDIPERHEDVTAEWLTQALRSGGVLVDQSVTGFNVDPISAARSRMSSLARITMEYDRYSQELPASMFAKFVSRLPANRERVEQRNLFQTEISLYENLGDAIPMNMPRMYFGGTEGRSGAAVLLLEDIKGFSKSEPPLTEEWSVTRTEALLALQELAKMHAKWWEDPTLYEHDWLVPVDSDRLRSSYHSYKGSWAELRGVMEPALSPAELRICDRLSNYLPTVLSELCRMPATLCHADFHVGNLLWDKLGEPETVWVVDWQAPVEGPIVLDVAELLGFCVPGADQRLVQTVYLPAYHEALINAGVAGYDYHQLLNDYRCGLLNLLQHFVVVLSVVDLVRADSLELIHLIVGRIAASTDDVGCGKLVG
jgi:hypothetical protein